MNTYQFEIEDARGTRNNECLLVEALDLEKAIKKAIRVFIERKKDNGFVFALNLKISIMADMFAQKNGGTSFTTQISPHKTRIK